MYKRQIQERRKKTLARLKEQYQNEMVDALMKKFGYKNVMQVPKLDKIVINMEMCIRDRRGPSRIRTSTEESWMLSGKTVMLPMKGKVNLI